MDKASVRCGIKLHISRTGPKLSYMSWHCGFASETIQDKKIRNQFYSGIMTSKRFQVSQFSQVSDGSKIRVIE